MKQQVDALQTQYTAIGDQLENEQDSITKVNQASLNAACLLTYPLIAFAMIRIWLLVQLARFENLLPRGLI